MSLKMKAFKKSIWVYHVACSPCNNCDIEILDLLTPRFDVERFGILLVGSPRHADALLVTGMVNRLSKPRLIEVYLQTPRPRVVFAFGSCGISTGIFAGGYNTEGPVDKVIHEVDPEGVIVYVPGCPPRPEAMIDAIVKALKAI
ncbi:hydrogenase [bacterium]|nr:hydrogenase [bacterium]